MRIAHGGGMKPQAIEFPNTLQEAMAYFADSARGLAFMVTLRWPDGKVTCPHCQAQKVSFLSTRSKWKCMACHKQFSAKVGTIFEDSALGYDKWFPAMWMIVNAKNGISSYEIHRALGVTQKTAWFMLHRIRLAMQNGSFDKASGIVESDETYIGGKSINMHHARRKRLFNNSKGDISRGKATVHGLLERTSADRSSRVKATVVSNAQASTLRPLIVDNVNPGTILHTDTSGANQRLRTGLIQEFVDHAEEYVRDQVHTNGIENFWSLLKRTLRGTYVSVDPAHLFRYLDEQVFRFNERKDCDGGRFLKTALSVVGKRIKYAQLIDGKGGEDLLPA